MKLYVFCMQCMLTFFSSFGMSFNVNELQNNINTCNQTPHKQYGKNVNTRINENINKSTDNTEHKDLPQDDIHPYDSDATDKTDQIFGELDRMLGIESDHELLEFSLDSSDNESIQQTKKKGRQSRSRLQSQMDSDSEYTFSESINIDNDSKCVDNIASCSTITPSLSQNCIFSSIIHSAAKQQTYIEKIQNEVIDLYLKEYTVRTIAKLKHISIATVYKYLKEKKVPLRKPSKVKISQRTKEKSEQAVKLYNLYKNPAVVEQKMNISQTTLYNYLDMQQTKVKKIKHIYRKREYEQFRIQAVQLYLGGNSVSEIAKELGISNPTIYRYLRQSNIAIKKNRTN